jgi:hypothetical protein
MYLVLIETSGNQRFIFSTNKLRENVGASELVRRAGVDLVLDAVASCGGPDLGGADEAETRQNLVGQVAVEAPGGTGIEVVLATSGKALVLMDESKGKHAASLVTAVTLAALREAPGLDVCGCSVSFDWSREALDDVVRECHAKLERTKGRKPPHELRFLRVPVVASCRTSGLPAAEWDGSEVEPGARSRVSAGKREVAEAARGRMQRVSKAGSFPADINEMEELFGGLEWVAIVHADGNGLGKIFLRFGERAGAAGASQNREYVNALRRFSIGLDESTEAAFVAALKVVPEAGRGRRKYRGVLPLVLGGDDLTVLCDGRGALPFAREFLRQFEQETGRNGNLGPVLGIEGNGGHLSACAGVAIVKPHFPFHAAYELAEELLRSAKTVKTKGGEGLSALDFHVLHDSSVTGLDLIRGRMTVDDGKTLLFARPIVVSDSSSNWVARHAWGRLEARVDALRRGEDDRRALPNSQAHHLRAGLFVGAEEADGRLKLLLSRYGVLEELSEERPGQQRSFFWNGVADGDRETGYLDAMEAFDFLGRK